jgi:hypothetical protein
MLVPFFFVENMSCSAMSDTRERFVCGMLVCVCVYESVCIYVCVLYVCVLPRSTMDQEFPSQASNQY